MRQIHCLCNDQNEYNTVLYIVLQKADKREITIMVLKITQYHSWHNHQHLILSLFFSIF